MKNILRFRGLGQHRMGGQALVEVATYIALIVVVSIGMLVTLGITTRCALETFVDVMAAEISASHVQGSYLTAQCRATVVFCTGCTMNSSGVTTLSPPGCVRPGRMGCTVIP